ncbi:MAG: DUF2254 domain-containing protein [Methylobacter sp.]|nr:DUF2254 domain-containing protein [Methylobacter sp.]
MALRQDQNGRLRVIACPLDFEEIVHAALSQICLYGAENPEVMQHLLNIIAKVSPYLHRDRDRAVLIEHARLIGEDAMRIDNERDRRRLANCLQKTLDALAQGSDKKGV